MTGSHCPTCNHAFGPLPGVPAHPLEPFGADVTCPECATVICADTMLVVGGSMVDAVGRVGTGRRVWLTLITAAPVLYFGSSVLSTLIRMSSGQWSGSVRDILGLVLFGVAVVMVVKAWRRWGAGEGDDARMAVAWELQWLVRPGSIEFIDHRLGRRVGPSGLADQVPSTCLQADVLRSAYAQAPQRTVKGRDGSIRSAVELVLEHWKPGRGGHWKGIGSNRICVDAGSAEDSPELERKAAAQADGDRLAERIFRHCTGQPVGVHGHVVTLRGHPDPVKTWPRPLRPATWVLGVMAVVLAPVILVLAFVITDSIRFGAALWLVAAGGALLLIATFAGLCRLLSRGAWRRELTRCVWTVDRQGLRVEQESRGRPRSAPEHRSWLVPADTVADVEFGTAAGRPRIILRGRDGGEQAAITPDTLPADGPEASRRCLLAALGLPAA